MKIRIEAEVPSVYGTKVFINDVEQEHLTGIEFTHHVGELARLRTDRYSYRRPMLQRFIDGARWFIRQMKQELTAK